MTVRLWSRTILCCVLGASALTVACAESTTPLDGSSELDSSTPADDGGGGDTDGGVDPDDAGGAFDAGPPGACDTPGAVETVPCGMCGTVDRFCTAEGVWAYGACQGEGGECAPGSVEAITCGDCGTQMARCTATCTWETTGECSGEGECTPGERTRSGAGCAAGETREILCNDACGFEPATACMADGCPTPGALETVPCGMCGEQDRFCSSARVWEYGACTDEGVCMPGTTGSETCGMCGTQVTRCTDACTWTTFGACGGEGTCTPGTTTRTTAGCAAGATRLLRCDAACGYTVEVEPCTTSRPVDVTIVLESTGSNEPKLVTDLPILQTRCIAPLLALRDVNVGISYSGDFPTDPYGATGDRPFEGGIEPGTSSAAISAELAGRPMGYGNDSPEATLEALSMLAGGPAAFSASALACSTGRTAGGCWRPGAIRVVVVHTDSAMHNGPLPSSTALHSPYTGITPVPQTWPDVRTRLMSTATNVVFIDSGATDPGPAQYDIILGALGQPTTDHLIRGSNVGPACDAIVARVRALAGL